VFILELVGLILYLCMIGFFIGFFALRFMFPWILDLGDYTRSDASWWKKAFALIAVLCIWLGCMSFVVVLPLIPAVLGILARKRLI